MSGGSPADPSAATRVIAAAPELGQAFGFLAVLAAILAVGPIGSDRAGTTRVSARLRLGHGCLRCVLRFVRRRTDDEAVLSVLGSIVVRVPGSYGALDVGRRHLVARGSLEQVRQLRIGRKPQSHHLLYRRLREEALLVRCQRGRATHPHFQSDDPILQLRRIGATDVEQDRYGQAKSQQPRGQGRPQR